MFSRKFRSFGGLILFAAGLVTFAYGGFETVADLRFNSLFGQERAEPGRMSWLRVLLALLAIVIGLLLFVRTDRR